jgi:hypothetical protein
VGLPIADFESSEVAEGETGNVIPYLLTRRLEVRDWQSLTAFADLCRSKHSLLR